MSAARISKAALRLLDASTLCAIATVSPQRRAHVNTAYFAWSPEFELVWVSEPGATHSKNVRASSSAAIAVYDSTQSWGNPDRGIQLFGTASEVSGRAAEAAAETYANRFPAFRDVDFSAYRLYRFRPRRLKLFDEHELGGGTFVTAKVSGSGALAWERTEIYESSAGGRSSARQRNSPRRPRTQRIDNRH
jgi:uncharacterized protein YhbP (UPF0306 family)